MKRCRILSVSLFFFLNTVYSQKMHLIVGTSLPVFYGIGVEGYFSPHIALRGEAGVLTTPYDVIILEVLKAFDTDELLLTTIGNAFSFGTNLQAVFNWHFRKNYIGATYSYLSLKAEDRPADIFQNYFGISMPVRRQTSLILDCGLHNGGLLYGRKFQLKKPGFSVNLELSIQKTFSSTSKLGGSSGNEFTRLSNAIDNELSQYFIGYGYIPGINIFLVYRPGINNNNR